ncbi:hypothetical protein GCM10025768_08670 [Microbacterium pseudoresistens]|uniref:Uncharacterized protein n=1 Tax=Microbacterium pseudoresistens TaxID=640634 RepID=A0A7Y9EVP9_9MICO|nr:hypothetical protein [Microbacterium pseudoresistens]NYD54768.1 hypothetical protein [Microbacterium pseudoresistens]
MTAPVTLPIPLAPTAPRTHEHAWTTESRHPTSEGVVVYVHCIGCAARRVDAQAPSGMPPRAMSRETQLDVMP